MNRQVPFVGAAFGIFLSTLGVVWDFLVFGKTSLIASPILKGKQSLRKI